jgi:nitrite reductase/ring-hydroxylating ferredoxin subunit
MVLSIRYSESNVVQDERTSVMAMAETERRDRRHVVCPVTELPPGEMRLVPIGRFGVGVFNVHGRFHAVTNYCPHEGGPLCQGFVRGTTQSAPDAIGGVRWVRDGEIIRCPWHQWEFDIATGETLSAPVRSIRTYPVEVVDGDVVVVL